MRFSSVSSPKARFGVSSLRKIFGMIAFLPVVLETTVLAGDSVLGGLVDRVHHASVLVPNVHSEMTK